MKNMKVAGKLTLGFAIVAVLMAIVGAVGIYGLLTLAKVDEQMYEENLIAMEAMGDIREAFQQERVYLRDMLIYIDNPDIVNASIENINTSHLRGDVAVQRYLGAMTDPALEGPFIEAGGLLDGPYFDAKEKIMLSARAGDAPGVLEGIEEASAYVQTIENNLAISEKNHVTWAAERYASNTALSRTLMFVQIGIIAAGCLIATLLGLYLAGIISKPLIILTQFMNNAGETGDISLRQEDVENIDRLSQIKDEIGQCIGSCAKFVGRQLDVNNVLECIADNDLTSELAPLSEKDSMGLSLGKMVENLNGMFHDINISAAQATVRSRQIADGAQTLAQGSAEQASAVEELSSSISDIAEKTRQNAAIAREAAELSGAIKDNAEKGNAQMDQMMQAVKDINDASSQIEKVIKVIDDIAFQTNILALNAAVEAARAGSAGKGFAVVAEEVRNLAAKSAEAAKDTGGLIENSIEKANLGLDIATQTLASLKKIVEGINRSTGIVADIARLSDEQANAIAQVNTGIDQVAQVVQQNSATAEESAAASGEMSEQSDMLSQLISQFKLKETRRMPVAADSVRNDALAASENASLALPDPDGEGYGKY